MGEDISEGRFSPEDYQRFGVCLDRETERLGHWLRSRDEPGSSRPRLGFEIEAWLIDEDCQPLPGNEAFLEAFDHPMATLELAQFNVELNSSVFRAGTDCFCMVLEELTETLRRARRAAEQIGGTLLMAGTLPTLLPEHLGLHHMSRRTRYQALNSAVLERRAQRPLRLEIEGREHLRHEHSDVMLEAAATSFQIHLETQPAVAHRVYNAALAASAPVLAASGNTPFLFGKLLWEESRIPLFEQAVEVGGFGNSARGPIRRVTFGSGYLRESIAEAFRENREHFPILLPSHLPENDTTLPHLRLHNGTIWRWNRPILGLDADGSFNLRIEHRSLPAGPTLEDMLANTAFLLGLIEHLVSGPGRERGAAVRQRPRQLLCGGPLRAQEPPALGGPAAAARASADPPAPAAPRRRRAGPPRNRWQRTRSPAGDHRGPRAVRPDRQHLAATLGQAARPRHESADPNLP